MGNVASGGEAASPTSERRPPLPPKDPSLRSSGPFDSPSGSFLAPSPASGPPRQKKKVLWKGKNITVLLPWDERGLNGKAPPPMQQKEVEEMLKNWEDQGYDTTGFNLEYAGIDNGELGAQGQSCGVWPVLSDIVEERQQRSFKVKIPDRKEWEAYVEELREAKLRALGVSLGDDDPPPPPTISPAVSNMSRQTSMQYPPLPFSPPLPTSSASSNHRQNPFSPMLITGPGLSTSQSSNPGSISSPASMHAHLQGKFNNTRHQSVSFTPGEHPFGSPFQYPQPQSPGVWSPQQAIFQQGHARGGSPSMHNLGSIMSPGSPFSQDGGYFQSGDVASQMQQRQQFLQTQLHHQQQLQMQTGARASPRLQELREVDDEVVAVPSKSPSKTPEARQIKHNPSASLQKEIDDAEYHLEEQFQRQLEHEDYSPHSDHGEKETRFADPPIAQIHESPAIKGGLGSSRFAISDDSDSGPILHHPQPHSRGHSLSQNPFQDSGDTSSATESKSDLLRKDRNIQLDISDLDTNPSNLGTPVQSNSMFANGHNKTLSTASNPWADLRQNTGEIDKNPRRPGHSAKASMSTLNVAAKEFKFNPASSFKPVQFSFGSNSFQPQQPVTAFSSFNPPVSATSSHFSNHSVSSSKINVTAPAFTPGQSEFSFSASGPSFRPDAPAFTPLNFTDSVGSGGSGSEGPRSSIFGNIDLQAIGATKTAKKSKAIPIVRPDSSHSVEQEEEVNEGKDGRIDRSEGRNKRARGDKEEGDSLPLFAEPSMPLSETSREQSPPKESPPTMEKPADKENSAPVDEVSPITPAKTDSSMYDKSPEDVNKDYAPFAFQQQKQVEDFNAARPFTSRRHGSGLPAYGFHAPSEDEEVSPVEDEPIKTAGKGHKKSNSSLSATAKPFEFKPGSFSFTFSQESEGTTAMAAPPSLPPKGKGLAASKYARIPSPPAPVDSPDNTLQSPERIDFQAALPLGTPPMYSDCEHADGAHADMTFEEIDAVMRHMKDNDLEASRDGSPQWEQPSPVRSIRMPTMNNSSPIRLQPQNPMRSDAPSPSPGRYVALPQAGSEGLFSHDPFIGDGLGATMPFISPSPIHRLNRANSVPASDWDDVLSETEEAKLQPRARFFDNHVNDLVGGLLAERLDPLERILETIQVSLEMMAARAPSSRRERRSISGALSDADDEDDDNPRRSHSPRRDKKLEKIKNVVLEALNNHQSSRPATATLQPPAQPESGSVLKVLEEMKEQFGQSMRLDLRGEDLKNVIEEAVERRMPATLQPVVDEEAMTREIEQRSRITQLEERLLAAEDMEQKTRIAELEERLLAGDGKTEAEIQNRRAAEDRLAEVQRLLRISSEEETRLREAMAEREIQIREVVNERDQKVRSVEESRAKTSMRIALLEAGQSNAQKSQMDLQTRLNVTESELQQTRQEMQHWQMESERAVEAAKRHNEDAEQANETNKELRRTVDSLKTQMEESIRVREGMRGKLMALQEDMARAARDISEDNARRAKKEQELIARQEVLDAKLQAEARTRERLELEIERLEGGEREGMRAVSDIKKLEVIVADLRMESHNAQKEALRYKREFEEARESGLSEVQRTRHYMQAEIESANNQVNVVREDLENQVLRLRAETDQVKLDEDTAKEKHEMLLEEANSMKAAAMDDLKEKHDFALEDIQAQHERQLGNTIEDAQRSEQHLLERLSLSSAKTEHLQDRVQHLEEKLEIANQAANAAAKAARSASLSVSPATPSASSQRVVSRGMDLPEKISPQALRESIMVLQEQLQDREQTIENLEATLSTVDLDAPSKISKRDDEIMWLRELLSVRKGDLQDIVNTLSTDQYDPDQIKDAAIRLSANLQMEEQERERALNGGSSLNLPNIAASLRDAASPRVAQAVGPLAAAWGNWRKSREPSVTQRSNSSTPTTSRNTNSGNQGFISGLMTPPTTNTRQETPSGSSRQPTAFGSTGQRFTSAQLANRPRVMSSRPIEGSSSASSPRKVAVPSTPPMMRKSSYDADARAEDFSDAGFYDDESENTVDSSMYGGRMVR
ncbi:hypothetical protein BJ875DRAFT_424579 [Amylocarpus encephaloides]|uniref:Myosin class II heavy chain n=1 Tax=Amylocarpus encephaloides TaxID=45428 RepID=A0A9P8C5E1_9HELO|nr:hypothetical protein BJ875DRAFT_424579 [Amylocarpus encephaloides]